MDPRERLCERLRESLAAGCASCVSPCNEVGGNPKQAAVRMLEQLLGARPVGASATPGERVGE